MKPTDNYAYSFDNEHYFGQYDSIRIALRLAKQDIKYNDELRDVKTIYIGRVYKFEPCVDAVRVIERVQDDAYDEADEYIGDYLDHVEKEEWQKLEAMLTETFNKWAKETDNEPSFFTVEDVKEYELGGIDCEH